MKSTALRPQLPLPGPPPQVELLLASAGPCDKWFLLHGTSQGPRRKSSKDGKSRDLTVLLVGDFPEHPNGVRDSG